MARITSKQAKEMNEAYAKVHRNLQEGLLDNIPSRSSQTRRRNMAGKEDLNTKTLGNNNNNNQSSNNNQQSTQSNNNNQQSNNNQTTQKRERPVSSAKQRWLDSQQSQKNLKDATKGYKFSKTDDGNIRADKVSGNNNNQQSTQSNNNNQQSNNNQSSSAPNGSGGSRKVDGKALMNKLKADSGDRVQSSGNTPPPKSATGGQQPSGNQSTPGVNRSQTVVKDGNKTTTTTRTSADNTTPAGAKAVDDFKAQRAERLNRLRSGGGLRPDGQGPSTGGTPPSTQSGAQRPVPQSGAQKPGLMGRLGSLAGRAANAARNAAGGIKQVATSTASNIKKGAQAVAGGIRQGAQSVSGALANKGPIQGRASGPQRRAQQAQQRTQQAQPAQQKAQPVQQAQQKSGLSFKDAMKAAQTKPGQDLIKSTQQPTAKPAPQLSGAQRAQQMAKERIAQGRNTVTGKLKSEKPKPKVTTWRELEGYDPMENLFDDTVQFLVSEGHAKDNSEAISIMSESEFIDAFNQELNE